MPDVWILVFIARGLIVSSGDTMTLEQCTSRAKELSHQANAVCINRYDPACRIYRDKSKTLSDWQLDLEYHCRRRNQPQQEQ